jgi:putative addiction module CopG family antidote
MSVTVNLPPELEAFAKQEVAAGRAASVEEVVAAGVRLLEVRQRADREAIEWLQFEIRKGLESGEPVELDIEDVIGRGRARWESTPKVG